MRAALANDRTFARPRRSPSSVALWGRARRAGPRWADAVRLNAMTPCSGSLKDAALASLTSWRFHSNPPSIAPRVFPAFCGGKKRRVMDISCRLPPAMRVALVYPPTCDPTAPYLAVPMLTGFLRANGVEVLPIDANVEAFDALLRPAPLAALRDAHRGAARASSSARASLDHAEQLEYARALAGARRRARGPGRDRRGGRDPARRRRASSTRERYARAVATIEAGAARDLGGAPPAAARLHRATARRSRSRRRTRSRATPRPSAIRSTPTSTATLVPRLRAARRRRRRALGLLPRAAPAGLRVRAQAQARAARASTSPSAAPAITQLLIRLAGRRSRARSGRSTRRCVFEGEHTLLALVRALDERSRRPPLRELPNVVAPRSRCMGARYLPGARHGGSARAARARLRRAAARPLLLAAT